MGRHNYYVPPSKQITGQHLFYSSTIPWAISMMFVKISIACMLLRIKRDRIWVLFLRGMIGVQIASCIASVVFQLVQCIPLAAIWDPVSHPDAVCTKPQTAFVSIYVNSAIAIATDFIFAALPLFFIRQIQRPLRERVILGCLMGLGVFAAITSIVKTTLVKTYGITGDTFWDAIEISLWSILEEQTGIIAACIPCLKSPFERFLGKLGLLSTSKRATYYHPSGPDMYGGGKSHQLQSLRPKSGIGKTEKNFDAQSEDNILPAEDEDKPFKQMMNGQILKTTELHFSQEDGRRSSMVREDDRKVDDTNMHREADWQAV